MPTFIKEQHKLKDSLDNLLNMQLLSTFGEKSAPADTLTRSDVVGIYEGAMRELVKSQDELGRMGDHYSADNPYFIELLRQYPDFYDWEKKLGSYNVGYQKYNPRFDRDMIKFEEAKKDTNYFNPAVYDSLIQAYNFDKLNKRKK